MTRQLRCVLWTIVTLIALATPLAGQAPTTLAGTWKLATPAEGRGGRGEGGVPGFPLATTLTIKVSPAEVTVDSDTGSARSIQTYRIVQAPGLVAIQYEMVHETRIIPLDGRPQVAAPITGHMGDARGHWEGDTLVVETTNFREESVYRGANPATLRITERFTRVNPNRVEWQVTFTDPMTWTKPWSFAMPLTMDASEQMVEYACHEGNRAMANILSAARADERAVEEAARKGIKIKTREIPTEAEGER